METSSEQTASAIGERDYRKARERYDRDQRFRAIVQSVTHDVLERHPNMQNREGCNLAEDMAATLLERVFSEDAELTAQRTMADRYRKIAEDVLALAPPRMFLAKPKSSEAATPASPRSGTDQTTSLLP